VRPLAGDDAPGATPIEGDDLDGLIPTFIATRADLNLAEQANIEKATRWAFRRRRIVSPSELLDVAFAREVHRRMFGDVWRWAGQNRTRVTNIGIEPYRITTEVKALLDDARYWHEHETYEIAERAVRLHHRLVSVHPFRNGNGRHSRFMADYYLQVSDHPRLAWGGGKNLVIDSAARSAYIDALREADRGDVQPLLTFALS
jgi:Fic-DOC domain mobile mystery protein B